MSRQFDPIPDNNFKINESHYVHGEKYIYNDFGYRTQVVSVEYENNGTGGIPDQVYHETNSADARGNILSQTLGNNYQLTSQYNPLTGLPEQIFIKRTFRW